LSGAAPIGRPANRLHLDVDLDVDIPTGFQELVRVTGTVPLTAEDEVDTWPGRPEPVVRGTGPGRAGAGRRPGVRV